MNFDFQTRYTSKTNQELLLIVSEPEKYQPEAISAANAILGEREVTEQERQSVYAVLKKAAESQVAEPESTESIFDDIESFKGLDGIWVRNWLIACSLITVAKPFSMLCNSLLSFIDVFFNGDRAIGKSGLSGLYDLLFLCATIGAVLLLVKKKNGWHLVVFYGILTLVTNLLGLVKYWDGGNLYIILASVLYAGMHGTVVGVLLTPTMRATFKIDQTKSVLTVIVSAFLGLIFGIMMEGGISF